MAHDMLKLRLECLETLEKGWISDIQFAHASMTCKAWWMSYANADMWCRAQFLICHPSLILDSCRRCASFCCRSGIEPTNRPLDSNVKVPFANGPWHVKTSFRALRNTWERLDKWHTVCTRNGHTRRATDVFGKEQPQSTSNGHIREAVVTLSETLSGHEIWWTWIFEISTGRRPASWAFNKHRAR